MRNRILWWTGLFAVLGISAAFFLYKLVFIDISPSVFTVLNEKNTRLHISADRKTLTGSFTAQENGLGILYLNAPIRKYASAKTLVFRLRKGTDPTWYYTRSIPEIDFYYVQPFPLGFPTIQESKNARIYFELSNKDSMRPLFKDGSLSIESKYKISIREALFKPEVLKPLIRNKFLYALRHRVLYMFIALSVIPLVMYLIFTTWPQIFIGLLSRIKETKSKWQVALGLVMLFDIFVIPTVEISVWLLIIMIVGHAILIRIKRFSWQVMMLISGLFLFLSIIFVGTEFLQIAHKTAGWFFVCLTITGVLLFISGYRPGKKL